MVAYVIVYRESQVRDQAAIERYSDLNRRNSAEFQMRFSTRPLVVYGCSEAPEGANPDGVVLLQFPTYQTAKDWYESPAYQEAVAHRKEAADWRVVIVEGIG